MKLTQDQIKYYIENYGDGDIYYSHLYMENGTVEVKYFPKFTKFVDESNIDFLKDEIEKAPHLQEKYLATIVLGRAFAYIPESKSSNKDMLVKNYSKFLSEIKNLGNER